LAARLIVSGDADVMAATATSLTVSLSATVLACLLGGPVGAMLAMHDFAGRRTVLVAANALLGLPPVVVGLAVFLLFSRAGPLGGLGWLFTTKAMVVAQVLLTLPIVVALTHRATSAAWRDYGDALRIDGARRLHAIGILLTMESAVLVTVALAAFGRAIAEVGAIMIAGGNIRGDTRTLTTAIVLETGKGEIALALALGLILVAITLVVSTLAHVLGEKLGRS
jgi:tungstate transport system permease protein